MIITFAITEQEKEEMEMLRTEVNFEMEDILDYSEEDLTDKEAEKINHLLEVQNVLNRLICVAENERMIIEDINGRKQQTLKEQNKMFGNKEEAHQSMLSMGVLEFSKFIREWIGAHTDDPELTHAYVERIFKTPVVSYQNAHKRNKQ